MLHGHHNERPLKLDAITGFVYSIRTREHVQSLEPIGLLMRISLSRNLVEAARMSLPVGFLPSHISFNGGGSVSQIELTNIVTSCQQVSRLGHLKWAHKGSNLGPLPYEEKPSVVAGNATATI
jgi:hypothetical protein